MRAFLLNFDADGELAGLTSRPWPRPVACRLLRARVRLVPRSDVVVGESQLDPAVVTQSLCWMPTPRALHALGSLGLPVPAAPDLAVLRAVNSRRFSAQLGSGPSGATWIESMTQLHERCTRITGERWLRKAHGFAGRGRQLAPAGALDSRTLAFAEAALRADGGFELAPRVRVLEEFALHGFLDREGALTCGQIVASRVDAHGQWLRGAPAPSGALEAPERDALSTALHESATALRAAGYFGPFGVDAFRYLDPENASRICFCPRSEINARYTLSWAIGMREARVDLTSD